VLALARDGGGARVVALGFDTAGSDLARRVAFPLFVHNALVWLDRRERDFRAWQPPGDALRAPGETRYDTGRAGLYRAGARVTAVSGAESSGAIPSVDASRHTGAPAPARAPLAVVLAAVTLLLLCAEWLLTARGRLR
jgi:hypothetical protein